MQKLGQRKERVNNRHTKQTQDPTALNLNINITEKTAQCSFKGMAKITGGTF